MARTFGRFGGVVLGGLALSLALTACSQEGANDLTGPDLSAGTEPVGEAGLTASAGAVASLDASSSDNRIEAELNPVINVDASGNARLEFGPGTANDRFDVEVEIAKRHFDRLGIDAGDGFDDEVVRLVAERGGVQVFAGRLRFSENRPADITFELTLRGGPTPELQRGDVIRVSVNGRRTLRGVMQNG